MKLTHPCKDTCSGYSQDCAQQVEALRLRVRELEAECSSMGRLLQSGVVIKNDEYSGLRKVVAAAREMRFYCLGSDASTMNMLEKFDSALSELDRAERGGG